MAKARKRDYFIKGEFALNGDKYKVRGMVLAINHYQALFNTCTTIQSYLNTKEEIKLDGKAFTLTQKEGYDAMKKEFERFSVYRLTGEDDKGKALYERVEPVVKGEIL